MMDPILQSWTANAAHWTAAVRQGEIASRRLATNQAIVDAVLSLPPGRTLDLGCGEGWLTRALTERGREVLGTDGVAELIDAAREKGEEEYLVATYQEIAEGRALRGERFATVVINFALIDQAVTEALLHRLPDLLLPDGHVVIQTLHPLLLDGPYRTGPRRETWAGLARDFSHPYEWYFRTLADWLALFRAAGFQLERIQEPLHPETERPLSIIFILKGG